MAAPLGWFDTAISDKAQFDPLLLDAGWFDPRGVASQKLEGIGVGSLPALVSSGSATQKQTAIGVASLSSLVASGVGNQKQTAIGVVSFPSLVASGVGNQEAAAAPVLKGGVFDSIIFNGWLIALGVGLKVTTWLT